MVARLAWTVHGSGRARSEDVTRGGWKRTGGGGGTERRADLIEVLEVGDGVEWRDYSERRRPRLGLDVQDECGAR